MESLKRALEQIGRMWANLSATQRVVLSAAAALMVVLLIFGSVSTTESWVRIAGPEVDGSKRADILKKLQERNQKHELRGAEILVPKQDADHIVLELAGEGAMTTNSVYKFLEQSDIFATRWQNEKRLQIALQRKLESMIRSVEGVRNATVVINPGSSNYQLGFAGPKPGAAVQVDLKDGMELSSKNVRAIAGLVARAVTGVEEEQVHIMDSKGKSYRAGAMDLRENEWSLERRIQENIKASLMEYPAAAVIVRVQAVSKTIKLEEVTPTKPVIVETQDSKKFRKGSSSASSGVRKGEGDSVGEPTSGGDETETQSSEKSIAGSRKVRRATSRLRITRVSVCPAMRLQSWAWPSP